MQKTGLFLIIIFSVLSCSFPNTNEYQYLLDSLNSQNIIELTSNNEKSRLIVSPFHQGKIIASTHKGLHGSYNGWVNHLALRDSSKNIGGEERLWIGPLGSQFSFYYQQIKPISDDNWQVPKQIGAEPYKLVNTSKNFITLSKTMQLINFTDTAFNLKIDRTISIFDRSTINKNLKIKLKETTDFIGFETKNTLTNLDSLPWDKETGLVNLWSAGMYKGTYDSTVIIPVPHEANLDSIYQYFNNQDRSRLQLKNNVLLFKGDGKLKTKIGVPPEFSPTIYGCYSKEKKRLTIIQFKKEHDSLYPNSFVSIQKNPFKGEAIPIYNNSSDFFELESQGPLIPLQPQASTVHWHRVYHFSDNYKNLNQFSKILLGIDLAYCSLK